MIIVEPSCDIHLARNTPGATEVAIRIREKNHHSDNSANPLLVDENLSQFRIRRGFETGMDYTINTVTDACDYSTIHSTSSTSIIVVNHPTNNDFKIIRVGSGSSTVTAYLTVKHGTDFIVVRITIHPRMRSWWIGNDSVVTPKDTRFPYTQIATFAMFDNAGAEIYEITGHGFVDYTPTPGTDNLIEVSDFDRILSKGNTGNTEVEGALSSAFTGSLPRSPSRKRIPVEVRDFLGDPIPGSNFRHNPIVGKVANGPHPRKSIHNNANFLFIGEGFSNESDFNRSLDFIKEKTFTSRRHSPFLWLRENFNLWKLWRSNPNNKDGISFGGFGQKGRGSNLKYGPVQVVSSHLGLMFDSRPGDKQSHSFSPPLSIDESIEIWEKSGHKFYLTRDSSNNIVPKRTLIDDVFGDPRRYPPEVNWKLFLLRYFTSMANPDYALGDSDYHVGQYWFKNHDGYVKDYRFVGILVNDYAFRAWNDRNGFFILSLLDKDNWRDRFNNISKVRDDYIDHDSPESRIHYLRRILTSRFRPKLPQATDVFVHEFGHSFDLGDEYEELGAAPTNYDDAGDNTNAIKNITDTLPADNTVVPEINYDKVKWAKLYRIKKSDTILSSIVDTANRKITLILKDDSKSVWRVKRWLLNNNENKACIWIRVNFGSFNRHILPTQETENNQFIIISDLIVEINSFISSEKKISFIYPEGTDLTHWPTIKNSDNSESQSITASSLLFEPKRDCDGNSLKVIDETIKNIVTNNSNLGPPFSNNRADCGIKNNASDSPTSSFLTTLNNHPKKIALNHDFRILGVYEGASLNTCNLFRPAGACKMRLEGVEDPAGNWQGDGQSEFCFLCKYMIVSRIDPGKLEIIEEQSYPEIIDYSCPPNNEM